MSGSMLAEGQLWMEEHDFDENPHGEICTILILRPNIDYNHIVYQPRWFVLCTRSDGSTFNLDAWFYHPLLTRVV